MGSLGVVVGLWFFYKGIKIMNKFFIYSTLVVAFVGVSGCESMGLRNKGGADAPVEMKSSVGVEVAAMGTGLLLSPNQRFNDVPLPMGAVEDISRTYVFESSTLKIGRMVYTLREGVNEIAQFYARECPAAGWKQEHVTQANGAELTFQKPGHRLLVTVRPQGVGRATLLIVHLTPEG